MKSLAIAICAFLLSTTSLLAADDDPEKDISSDAGQTVQDTARSMGDDVGNAGRSWDEKVIDWALDRNQKENSDLNQDK